MKNKRIRPILGSLPFFIDERMYVISYTAFPENRDISKNDLFRISELNGV